ncbi:MAG: hypothetical protein RSC07_04180, partial [Mucinivorans sp.]
IALTYRQGIDAESYMKSGDLLKEGVFSDNSDYNKAKLGKDDDFDDDNFLTIFHRKSGHKSITTTN